MTAQLGPCFPDLCSSVSICGQLFELARHVIHAPEITPPSSGTSVRMTRVSFFYLKESVRSLAAPFANKGTLHPPQRRAGQLCYSPHFISTSAHLIASYSCALLFRSHPVFADCRRLLDRAAVSIAWTNRGSCARLDRVARTRLAQLPRTASRRDMR